MNAAANVTSKSDLDALRLTLSLFFAELAQKAIDKMWDTMWSKPLPDTRRHSTESHTSTYSPMLTRMMTSSLIALSLPMQIT